MRRLRVLVTLTVLGLGLSVVGAGPAAATFPAKNGLIAFSADTDEGSQIFTVARNGHDLRQITHGPAPASSPDWSPDGRWLAYTLDECTIAIVRADGGGQRVVPGGTPDTCEFDPVFTPDGRRLVFSRYDPAVDQEAAWVMDLKGRDRRLIGTGPGGAATPDVSPDGRTVTFLSATSSGLNAIFATSMRGGGPVRQITPTLFGISYKHDWAPDGSRIVMSDNASDAAHPTNVVTIRPDGNGIRDLTRLTTLDERAVAGGYSPDGRWIAYRLERGDQSALVIMRPDGHGERTVLPFSSFKPRFIDWGPAA